MGEEEEMLVVEGRKEKATVEEAEKLTAEEEAVEKNKNLVWKRKSRKNS